MMIKKKEYDRLIIPINPNAPQNVKDEVNRINEIVMFGTIAELDELIGYYKCAIKMLETNGRSLMAQSMKMIVTDEQVKDCLKHARTLYENLMFARKRKIDQK